MTGFISKIKLPSIVLALLIQLAVLLFLALAVWLAHYFIAPPYPLWVLVLLQGGLAAVLSCKLGLPCWWRWIQLLIPIGLYVGLSAQISSWWGLAGFVLLFMVFFNASSERVPLYLSNATTHGALQKLAKEKGTKRFMDLGSGLGGAVVAVAQVESVEKSEGVENAPLPYAVSGLRQKMARNPKLNFYMNNIWQTDLSHYDLVYAFLSPEPMERLWEKVCREMPKEGWFVSNSFAVPNVEPTEVWELEDGRRTQLFLYKVGEVCSEKLPKG